MSLSQSQEVQTVHLSANPPAGGEDTVQIDADEDRKIIGFALSTGSIPDGGLQTEATLYTGVDPEPASSEAKDLGGKFYTEFNFRVVNDDTNGTGWATETMYEPEWVDDPDIAFDWNEDVTLTLHTQETNGANSGTMKAEVYYVEA